MTKAEKLKQLQRMNPPVDWRDDKIAQLEAALAKANEHSKTLVAENKQLRLQLSQRQQQTKP